MWATKPSASMSHSPAGSPAGPARCRDRARPATGSRPGRGRDGWRGGDGDRPGVRHGHRHGAHADDPSSRRSARRPPARRGRRPPTGCPAPTGSRRYGVPPVSRSGAPPAAAPRSRCSGRGRRSSGPAGAVVVQRVDVEGRHDLAVRPPVGPGAATGQLAGLARVEEALEGDDEGEVTGSRASGTRRRCARVGRPWLGRLSGVAVRDPTHTRPGGQALLGGNVSAPCPPHSLGVASVPTTA